MTDDSEPDFDAIQESAEQERRRRETLFPDTKTCLQGWFDTRIRMLELGWRPGETAPFNEAVWVCTIGGNGIFLGVRIYDSNEKMVSLRSSCFKVQGVKFPETSVLWKYNRDLKDSEYNLSI